MHKILLPLLIFIFLPSIDCLALHLEEKETTRSKDIHINLNKNSKNHIDKKLSTYDHQINKMNLNPELLNVEYKLADSQVMDLLHKHKADYPKVSVLKTPLDKHLETQRKFQQNMLKPLVKIRKSRTLPIHVLPNEIHTSAQIVLK